MHYSWNFNIYFFYVFLLVNSFHNLD